MFGVICDWSLYAGLFSVVRQQKYLREKTGGIEEEEDDDAEEDEKKDKLWSRRKSGYHGGDNVDYEVIY